MKELNVNEIFRSIQGEGEYAGTPCIFIRLQGCSVGCTFCDTKYAMAANEIKRSECTLAELDSKKDSAWIRASVDDVACRVQELCHDTQIERVVVTGGEPFEQPEALVYLLEELLCRKFCVSIESSGAAEITEDVSRVLNPSADSTLLMSPTVYLTISPKEIKPPLQPYLERANEIKILVAKTPGEDVPMPEYVYKLLRNEIPGKAMKHVFFQPTSYGDQKLDKQSLIRTIDLCYTWGVPMSVQLHKYLQIR